MEVLGIDIGGTGIKSAIVDIEKGVFISKRQRIPTPEGAKPEEIALVIKEMIKNFDYKGPIGCGFPGLIKNGVVIAAANLDKAWAGIHINDFFASHTGLSFNVLNDVDVMGIAEITHGAGKDAYGSVLVVSFGTGIGTALFRNKMLFPNTEFGHMYMPDGKEAEHYTANSARKREDMSYGKFAKRVSKYLNLLSFYVPADLIIFGGGISKKWKKFGHLLEVETKILPAELKNHAGIVGAACSHAYNMTPPLANK